MEEIAKLTTLLFWPFLACLAIGLLHAYAGLHVLRRGVIFVDLALAQMAALGAIVGLYFGGHEDHDHTPHPQPPAIAAPSRPPTDELDAAIQGTGLAAPKAAADAGEGAHHHDSLFAVWPMSFALGGAFLLAFTRGLNRRVPHEAIIGIVYVVAAAVCVLLLSKLAHGHEQTEQMLTGKLLFVDHDEVLATFGLYAVLGLLHFFFYRRFLTISTDADAAEKSGVNVRLWDTLFYAMFALMVTRSVAIGGVLVVFSYLIIPGACAGLLVNGFGARILVAWLVAIAVSFVGMGLSAVNDLPSGTTVVATFGAMLVACVFLGRLVRGAAAEAARESS